MRGVFEGFYFKHQASGCTLALIPGISTDCAFIQIITDNGSYNVEYPKHEYKKTADTSISIGGSVFSKKGIHLNIQTPVVALTGVLAYKNLTPLKSDIMGPFRFLPMECRHGVISMRHSISGSVTLNGETVCFDGGTGYIETDSGTSFPKDYTWIQCNDFGQCCSIMASVAHIPFAGAHFRGCICAILLGGREYRLATYKGVKIMRCEDGSLELAQGKFRLEIAIECQDGHLLRAPKSGLMRRMIRECVSCPARFRFTKGETTLFEGKGLAGYEYVSGDM